MAKRVGVLSDTHGYWDERYAKYFAECDEIWHCGDIGSAELLDKLEAIKLTIEIIISTSIMN